MGMMGAVQPSRTLTPGIDAEPRRTLAIRVVVVEQIDVLRAGMVQTLRRLEIPVVGEAATAEEAVSLLITTGADVLLLGARVDVPVSRLVARAKALPSSPRVVHVADTTDRDEYVNLLKAGVDAIVPLASTMEELGETLARVQRGERILGRTSLAAVRRELLPNHYDAAPALSRREQDVLVLLPTRRTLAEIGEELYVSTATVKSHVSRIYAKLGVTDRHSAVERAVGLSLLG
ncbi:MAG: two component transcriptional regulator, LuxR family [Actinomycetia bacterium]|nr:two component transcriptional regulator, LuxR family [Actinomycetes bacterium]